MIDPRAPKGHETGDTVKKYYCKHCNERLRQKDGIWIQLARNNYQQDKCRGNADGHAPR